MAAPAPAHARSDSQPLASQRYGGLAAAALCVMIAGYLFVHNGDQDRVRTASELAIAGKYDAAITEARRVTRVPTATSALLVRAYAAQALDRHRDAVSLFRRAADRDPRSWSLHRDWAISLLALGKRREARRQMDLASTLNPRMVAPPGF